MHKNCWWILLVALWSAHAQIPEDTGYLRNPQQTGYGVMCTNNFGSSLYLLRNGTAEELVAGPGVGAHYTVSPAGDRVGMKVIDPDGSQTPALLDLATHRVTPLHEPGERMGQVSFTEDGRCAFTVGERLLVTDGNSTLSYDLGYYANRAPISPDGSHVAWNDADDQIWILTLATGERRCVSDGIVGYHAPAWAPRGGRLLFQALHGTLRVFDPGTKKTYSLGEGQSPSWASDSRTVVFARVRAEGGRLVSSDLYRVRYDGSDEVRMTNTQDLMEMDPAFTSDGAVLYHTFTQRTIASLPGNSTLSTTGGMTLGALPAAVRVEPRAPAVREGTALDIPYVHQVYDTPDWFNGHWACAPTQAIMVLAYYALLPKWDITCSWPSPHVTSWGRYVTDLYRFRQNEYSLKADDPNGIAGMGGYGYMWTGSSSPHSRMAGYFSNHGMTATQSEGTPHSVAAAEVAAGYPFSMCVLLTTAGHLVLAHGFGAEEHTLVFNDPYGDKNRGYMNYYGKNVRYDWPGYNNGYQNLNEVAWCIATRPPSMAARDSIIDDLHFERGFSLATAAPASMAQWRDMTKGYNTHFWYTYTKAGSADTCYAVWRPQLQTEGLYEVYAYIPFSNATDARYVVASASGQQTVVVNQKNVRDAWVSLGSFVFSAGNAGNVRLGDASSTSGQELVYDALRWNFRGGIAAVGDKRDVPLNIELEQNYPNPFNPSTTIGFALPRDADVRLEVITVLGEVVESLVAGHRRAGKHSVIWIPRLRPSGVYFARLTMVGTHGESAQRMRPMLLLK